MTTFLKTAAFAAAATAGMLTGIAPAAAATGFDAAGFTSVQSAADSWEHSRYRDDYRHRNYSGSRGYYGEPVYRNTRTWRGRDGRYYCRRGNGTTGLIIGGAAGALLGRGIDTRGDRATGTILGAAGGALLGRSVDRNRRCR